jgi:hypothetical protein
MVDNKGYEFRKNNNFQWYNSDAHSMDEVPSNNTNGGYVITGSVRNNPQTGGSVAGGSDILFAHLSANGGVVDAMSIDHAGTEDVGYCIKRSTAPNNAGTYLICGSVRKSSVRTDCFVARVSLTGTVYWFKTFNLDTTYAGDSPTAFNIAYSLAEVPSEPDIIPDYYGNIHVVGTYQDASSGQLNGFYLRLDKNGNYITSCIYFSPFPGPGTDNVEFRSIKWSDDNNLLVTGSTTGLASGLLDGPHTLLVKLTPIIGGLMGTRILRAVNLAGFPVPSVGRDLVERINTTGAAEHYVSGFAWDMGPLSSPLNIVIKADFIGMPVAQYFFSRSPFPFTNAIDFTRNSLQYPGFALFTGSENSTISTISDSYIAKAYFNGFRCVNNGINALPMWSQLNVPAFSTLIDTNISYNVTTLKAKVFGYQNFLLCNQLSIVGGNNAREGEFEITEIQNGLTVYPNPATKQLFVQTEDYEGAMHLSVINSLGQLVISETVTMSGEPINLDVSQLENGIYFIECIADGRTLSSRFMVNR